MHACVHEEYSRLLATSPLATYVRTINYACTSSYIAAKKARKKMDKTKQRAMQHSNTVSQSYQPSNIINYYYAIVRLPSKPSRTGIANEMRERRFTNVSLFT